VFLERLFTGCQIQRSLTLKSLQSVGVVGALMELIQMSGAGNVNGKGLEIRWSKSGVLEERHSKSVSVGR
jgi:hypothetical protein